MWHLCCLRERHLLRLVTLLIVLARLAVAPGSLRPLLDPVPASAAALFVLRLLPQVEPPAGVTRTKVILQDVGFDLKEASSSNLVSAKGLPPVLQVGGLIGDGARQLSLLLDAPLVRGSSVEILLRMDAQKAVPRVVAPEAHVIIKCSIITRPNMFDTVERIPVPLDAEVQAVEQRLPALQGTLLSPTAPSQVSTPRTLSIVTYQFRLDLAGVAGGDILHVVPLAALHNDFQVARGSDCPRLAEPGIPIGVHMSWQVGGCRLVQLPQPQEDIVASLRSNAIEIALAAAVDLNSKQTLVLALPAPPVGSGHSWLLALAHPAGPSHSANTSVMQGYDIFEIGAGKSWADGLAIEPRPHGAILATSSRSFAAAGITVDLSVVPDVDLRGDNAILIRPTTDAIQIRACQDVEYLSGEARSALIVAGSISGISECRISAAGQHLAPEGVRRIRLIVDGQAGSTATVAFLVLVDYAPGQVSSPRLLLGQYVPSEAEALTDAKLGVTGSLMGRPTVFLITFRTSSADGVSLTGSVANTTIFPAWRAPASCSMGCARWAALSEDGNSYPQGNANVLWGFVAEPPAGAGRACARPAAARRKGPWCFCRGQLDKSWGYCEAEVSRLRLRLLDASKWQLLRARDGAKLSAIPEAHASDCAIYLRDISAGSAESASASSTGLQSAPPAPRRCWGDEMRETGDSVYIEWWPGLGLESGQIYALEVVGMFLGSVPQFRPALLNVAVMSSTTEGPYMILQEAELGSDASSIKESGSQANLPQQPSVSKFSVQLVEALPTSPPTGRFSIMLLSGGDESQWLLAGHLLDLFFHPLSTWDVAAEDADCPPLHLAVGANPSDVEPTQPVCRSYSIGGAAVQGRHNAIRLVLGEGTVISAQSPSFIHATLPLPSSGVLGARFAVSVRHQDQFGEAAWYKESDTQLTWKPRILAAGLMSWTKAVAEGNLTVRLAFVPATTVRGILRRVGDAGAAPSFARLRVMPPAGFVVQSVDSLSDDTSSSLPVDLLRSGPVFLDLAGESGGGAGPSSAEGDGYEVAIRADSILFAGAWYILQLRVIASPPSRAQQQPWYAQLVAVANKATDSIAGPTRWFDSGSGLQAGIAVPGSLRASVVPSLVHASSRTTLAVYFQPAQTHGIFFRYIVLTAPRGFDFATVRGPGRSAAGTDGVVVACKVLPRLALPLHVQCRPEYANAQSESHDVATVILPPLSQLGAQPYGFTVEAILPPFSIAWVEEASGRSSFALETRTEDGVVTDTLAPLPSADWPHPQAPWRLLLPTPLPVYPRGCASAHVQIDGLPPEQVSVVRFAFQPGVIVDPPIFLYIHAPLGYSWVFEKEDWSVSVARGGPGESLGFSDFKPALLPNGNCIEGLVNVLCVEVARAFTADESYTITAQIRTPFENPDVPQVSNLLPSPAFWHVTVSSAASLNGSRVLLRDRVLGCFADFKEPNRIRRIYTAEATPSNTVVRRYASDGLSSPTRSPSLAPGSESTYADASEDLNDVAIALTTVTIVPRGGGLVVTAPTGAFAFPAACELANTPTTATSSYGLPVPQSAGADCKSSPDTPHIAVVSFVRGDLAANSYLFTIKGITNVRTIDEYDAEALWQVHTVADTNNIGAIAYLDHPLRFTAFSVLEAMEDAFIDTSILDLATTHFTKRRSAINEVVICFRQSVATPAGQTLNVYLPEGFRIPWKDSDDCFLPDPRLGVPPIEILRPFGNVTIDSSQFTTLPRAMKISCASSTDGGIAYFTLSLGLVEISRYYALRLLVQNADRSPPSNIWRLALGRQASRPIPGFTMQAFTRLDLNTSVSSAAQDLGGGPPNIVQVSFQPSVPVPAGGAMRLLPPEGFELVSAVPRTSQGVILRASARCTGASLFLGTDYTYAQCEATCRQRTSCTLFSVGFGTKAGECIQEAVATASGSATPTCEQFVPHSSFNVYRIAPSGDCFRFTLLEGSKHRRDIDCSLRHNASTGITSAVFQLSVTSPPLAADQLYVAAVAVSNPTATPNQNVWGLQSFSQASLSAVSLLDDGIADGFELTLALSHFAYTISPAELQHTVGAEVTLAFHWASSVAVRAGIDSLDDILRADLPGWLKPVENVCETLSTVPAQGVQHKLSQCGVSADRRSVSLVITGPASALAPGSRLDFSFRARNPTSDVVKALPRDEVALVSLTHLRPVVSTVTGKARNTTLASASAAAHTVQLPLRNLVVRQTDPPFSVAGHRPMTLEVQFEPQSSGANQIWISTSLENPLDFTEASCTVSSTQDSSGDTLFGQFSCTPRYPVFLRAQGRTHLSQLRVDAKIPLPAGQLYRLTVGGVGSGLQAGPVLVNVSTSNSELSADYRDYEQALLLDSLRGASRLTLAGRLDLRPLGAGSFVALSASAEFGAASYVAPDHVHFVTMAFALDVPAGVGDRLILYPSSQIDALDGSVRLGLSAAGLLYEAEVLQLNDQDDIFQHAKYLGLPRPGFRQRIDVLILEGRGILAGQTASLRLQAMVLSVGTKSAVGVDEWLMLASTVRSWSADRDAISNSNQQEWPGGALSVLPAFDPYASMMRVSGQRSVSVNVITAFLAPTAPVPWGRTLRISAPSMFIWAAECVIASSPMVLVQQGQCWRDGKNPEIVLLPLNAPLRTGVVHELVMKVITPTMIVPPNLWEFSVLQLPTRGVGESDPWLKHGEAVPEQVIRLFGFELEDLQVTLEPQAPLPRYAQQLMPLGHSLLLSLRLKLADGNNLRLQASAPLLQIVAPYPLAVDCPPPRMPASGAESLVAAWEAWEVAGGTIEYPDGLELAGSRGRDWVNSQLIGLHQQPVAVRRCTREGWRGNGGLEVADGRRSSIKLELLTALPRDQWLVLPLLTRLVSPAAGSLEESADEFAELSTPFKFWRVELASAIDGGVIQASDTVRLRPAIVLNPAEQGPGAAREPSEACASTDFCASVAGVRLHGGLPPQFGIQLDRGSGISVRFEFSFPRGLRPAPAVPVKSLREAFHHKALGSPFPADVLLGSYVEIAAPVPLLWTYACSAAPADASDSDWRAVCFDSTAYLFLNGKPRPAGLTTIVVSNVSLIQPLARDAPLGLPMSDTWVLSLFEAGVLRGQRLVEGTADAGLARFVDHGLGNTRWNAPVVGIGLDASDQCASKQVEDYLCPSGMFAYGVHAVRLGGVDSWLDSLQLLCREEVDIGGNYTQLIRFDGVSTVAGDVHLGSRSNEKAAGTQSDIQECGSNTSSVVVGGRIEVWRKRRIMGLAVACLPRASVERWVPWDRDAGKEVRPRRVANAAADTYDASLCNSNLAVTDDSVWGGCEAQPDMRSCPQDPSLCCCIEGFSYNEQEQRCELCSRVQQSGPLSGVTQRLCPVGSAVVGFRAATLHRSGAGGAALAIQNDASSICAIELLCQALQPRRYAGPGATRGVARLDYIKEEEEVTTDAVTSFTDPSGYSWWQYAGAGGVLLILARIAYVCCCKSRQPTPDYMEDDEDENWTRAVVRRVKKPFVATWRVLIKPVWDWFKVNVWEPVNARILLPFYFWFIETRCYRCLKSVILFMWKWFLRLCPWVVWIFKCSKNVKKKLKKRMSKSSRGSYQQLSPTSMKKRWDDGTLSPAGSPRRLACEIQKRIREGQLSPRSMKAELAKLVAKGEIDQGAYGRRLEVLELALSDEDLEATTKSFLSRISSMSELRTTIRNSRNTIKAKVSKILKFRCRFRRRRDSKDTDDDDAERPMSGKDSVKSDASDAAADGGQSAKGEDFEMSPERKRGKGASEAASPKTSPKSSPRGDDPKTDGTAPKDKKSGLRSAGRVSGLDKAKPKVQVKTAEPEEEEEEEEESSEEDESSEEAESSESS